jgi:hypothetical protein
MSKQNKMKNEKFMKSIEHYPKSIKDTYNFLFEYCKNNNIDFTKASDDGRINSALDENTIIKILKEEFPGKVEKPKSRAWYDFVFYGDNKRYFINIKCSTGGTDNAMNKKAVIYSLADVTIEDIPSCMTYNKMLEHIEKNLKRERDVEKEYYYLYFDKKDGTIIIKSLLDIQNLRSNPCNILQINWTEEKKQASTFNNEKDIESHKKRVLRVISKSLKQFHASCSQLLELDL